MKTLAKYADTAEIMDGTFSRPKYKMSGEAAVSIEGALNKAARSQKIRKTIITTLNYTLGLGLTAYVMGISTLGTISLNPLQITTYPAFSNAMEGGYIQETNINVHALLTGEAPKSNLSGYGERIVAGFTGYDNDFTGTVLNTDTLNTVTISGGKISFTENNSTITNNGTYNGEKTGSYTLKDEYIIECISGACAPGETVIVSKNSIIGVVP